MPVEASEDDVLDALARVEAAAEYADAEAAPRPRVFGTSFAGPILDVAGARSVVAGLRPAVLPPLSLPARFGPLVVDRPGGAGTLAIDASEAFGSGLHPTTAMMLARIAAAPPRGRVLDVGTGTGVLALASLQQGAEAALGVDIAAEARRLAAENAARAGLQEMLQLSEEIPGGPFDHGLANVRARPLVALASRICAALGPGAALWLSGVRVPELDEVLRAYRAAGFEPEDLTERDGWVSAALTR